MTKLRSVIVVLTWAAMSLPAVRADVIFTLDRPDQSGVPGALLQYFATLNNTGPATVYLNGSDLSLTAPAGDFTTLDLFFDNAPLSLDSGASSGSFELFDVTVAAPFPDVYMAYTGVYTLSGGVDSNAQDVLGVVTFSATAVPEPRSVLLLVASLGAVVVLRRPFIAARH